MVSHPAAFSVSIIFHVVLKVALYLARRARRGKALEPISHSLTPNKENERTVKANPNIVPSSQSQENVLYMPSPPSFSPAIPITDLPAPSTSIKGFRSKTGLDNPLQIPPSEMITPKVLEFITLLIWMNMRTTPTPPSHNSRPNVRNRSHPPSCCTRRTP